MNYKKAILIHAYAIPLGIFAVVALLLVFVPSKFDHSQTEKRKDFEVLNQVQTQVKVLESKVAENKESLLAWKKAMESEFTTSLNALLQKQLENLDGRQLEQTSASRPTGGGGFALSGGQSASRLQLEFRGGFEPMQKTILALEAQLPQMQLETIEIAPDNSGEALKFNLFFTAWEK